ncbi:MFS transporter [Francisella tularensis]|uniref:MFS transporter n=1 Tax=Francisella tularensis TaxID=263 RepID=UPI0014064541|nr:MFS transporter [Francisella tularensis]MBK2149833.1 MFS transporter [Francisella tularensis]MBK2250957.1 MFS transporter [Francisella tularensis]NDS80630.1 multidrug effflux MFS transporter [Francisella tularensis subsp. holarctica]UZW95088.1 MFS transporter [Francisella tularensis subsp. holarctica]
MLKAYRIALIFSGLIVLIGLMSIDFISPSLTYIKSDFETSQTLLKNSVLTYMLILGIFQLPYGFLSDRYGRKKLVLISLSITILGILISAFAQGIVPFYIGRIVTAIGSSGCPVISRSIIADVSHNPKRLRKSFSLYALASQISLCIAPVLGAFIQSVSSWRFSLITLLLINIVVFLLILLIMPETSRRLEYKINYKTTLDKYLYYFKNRYFFIMSLLSALFYVYSIGFYNMLPFVLHHLGIPVITNGFINSFYAISLATGAFSLQRFLYRYASEKILALLLGLFLFHFIAFILLFKLYTNTFTIIIFGIGTAFLCGIIAPLILSMCMQGFKKDKGIASAVQSAIKMFFTGVGLIIFSYIKLESIVNPRVFC